MGVYVCMCVCVSVCMHVCVLNLLTTVSHCSGYNNKYT